MIKLSFSFFATLFLAGCTLFSSDGSRQVDGPIIIRTGESFGECLGYCRRILDIDEDTMIFTAQGWGAEEYPDISLTRHVGEADWNLWMSLLNLNAFEQMDDVYGCPDCADGGAEWLEIQRDSTIKRVTFEYMNSPAEIKALADTLRFERNRLKGELLGRSAIASL